MRSVLQALLLAAALAVAVQAQDAAPAVVPEPEAAVPADVAPKAAVEEPEPASAAPSLARMEEAPVPVAAKASVAAAAEAPAPAVPEPVATDLPEVLAAAQHAFTNIRCVRARARWLPGAGARNR